MRTLGWITFAAFAALSAASILGNYLLMWRELRAKRDEKIPSLIPIMGGMTGYVAVRAFFLLQTPPNLSHSWHFFLPALLDPGCYLVYFLIMPLVWKWRGYSR